MMRIHLHGWGSSAAEFARTWAGAGRPPGPDDCFLDGLEHDALTGRRRWFAFSGIESALARRLRDCAPDVEALVAAAMRSRGLAADTPVALVGHSQGAMLALQLMLRARLVVARVEGYAGFLPEPASAIAAPRAARSAVRLLGAAGDRHVPPARVVATAQRLRALGVADLQCRIVDGPGHAFSAAWLAPASAGEHADA